MKELRKGRPFYARVSDDGEHRECQLLSLSRSAVEEIIQRCGGDVGGGRDLSHGQALLSEDEHVVCEGGLYGVHQDGVRQPGIRTSDDVVQRCF